MTPDELDKKKYQEALYVANLYSDEVKLWCMDLGDPFQGIGISLEEKSGVLRIVVSDTMNSVTGQQGRSLVVSEVIEQGEGLLLAHIKGLVRAVINEIVSRKLNAVETKMRVDLHTTAQMVDSSASPIEAINCRCALSPADANKSEEEPDPDAADEETPGHALQDLHDKIRAEQRAAAAKLLGTMNRKNH